MSAKETFLRVWDREARTTSRVFKSFPPDHLDVKPHEGSRSIRELAWQCVADERVIAAILESPVNDLRDVPMQVRPPETMGEIISAYEEAHRAAAEKLRQMSEEEFSRTTTALLHGGEWKTEQPETLWSNLMDEVHHRGQLTIYLRQAGGKVPSIYGPSADEAAAL